MPPFVSIVVPCYNEEATIRLLLESILKQTYPRASMEVVIADGLSQDRTRQVITSFQAEHADLSVRVVDNRQRTIPSSLNRALEASRGEIVVRLDAHSMPIPGYVDRCVRDLEQGLGSNVGGIWMIQPGEKGWVAEGIAAAAAHPLGVGDAMYRLKANAGPVDTVPFGAFRRSLLDRIGSFDETLLTNEDYEFNARVRQAGGIVWLDPGIRSTYVARSTLFELARQYSRYGFWKFRMLRRYPDTLRWRQALPPLFVTSLIGLVLLAFFFPLMRFLLILEMLIYLLILLIAGTVLAIQRHKPLLMPGLLLAIMTMHIFWGSGFLWSLLSTTIKKNG